MYVTRVEEVSYSNGTGGFIVKNRFGARVAGPFADMHKAWREQDRIEAEEKRKAWDEARARDAAFDAAHPWQ